MICNQPREGAVPSISTNLEANLIVESALFAKQMDPERD